MKFTTLLGNQRTIPKAKKYLINWSGSSRSKIQKKVKVFLEEFWKDQVVFEEFPIAGTRMSLDFYNANKKIAIEVQGAQHTKYVPFFHRRRSSFASQVKRDNDKMKFCELNNILFVEVYPTDTLNKTLFESQGVYLG